MGADLRMQLTLRALVDDMIRDGWQVVSRSPDFIMRRMDVGCRGYSWIRW